MNLQINTKIQKYIFLFILFLLNIFLSVAIFIYWEYWYLYLIILTPSALFNVIIIFNLVITSPYFYYKKENNYIYDNKTIISLIPCYNESYEELFENINSLVNQNNIENHKNILVIICDGKVKGNNNDKKTNEILLDIFKDNITSITYINDAYKTCHNEYNQVELVHGIYNNVPFIIINKEHNMGKRDSLYIIRSFCYKFNEKSLNLTNLDKLLLTILNNYKCNNIDAIIGTDGDTVFDSNCSFNLIKSLYKDNDKDLVAVCGYIKISNHAYKWSLWTIFQHTEYIYAQLTKRLHQSRFTKKVSCLPGCVQIIKVCKETCSPEVLDEFYKLPNKNALLTHHIRSYASEDRNHACIMLYKYPYVKLKQSLDAIAYTRIPNNISVLLSQRRRWTLGATSNDYLLILKPDILLFERLSAIASSIAWFFTIFIIVATVSLIMQLIRIEDFSKEDIIVQASVYALGVVIIFPMTYLLISPLWFKLTKIEIIQLYIGIIIWYFIGILLVFIIHLYTLYNLDDFSWGKTRINKNDDDDEYIEVSTPLPY